ncbi:DUF1289 domain-containing protein [Aporhodopirellula aestuarii]|uniref:DUF1289 domain-containing protein n=1 Tax=Aporhodopirellula aestuarii TaxID=2950107 RepID=A0ABT0TYV7_9BACT|nr:DUF1289 domain-containing protein [Aporhodopirellula aestuarii]MCM2369564.1 DUF1289 domain-containing protein [Aporhodopirellula aestuarii]
MSRLNQPLLPPRSPCIGICKVNEQQICSGCHRTLSEIGRWSIASTDEKRSILNDVQRRRFESVFPASGGQDAT